AHHHQHPGPRHAGARVHRGGAVPAAVPRAEGEAVRPGLPAVPPPGAAGPAEPSIFGGGVSHGDPGRAAGIRCAVRGRCAGGCRAGRVGDAHVARARMDGGSAPSAALGGSARGVREHRELRGGAARVSRAQAHGPRDRAVPLSDGVMSITVLGVNHRTAPLEVRERFAHAAGEVPRSLERVLAAGARGGVMISTCNRTEFYLAEPDDALATGAASAPSSSVAGSGKIFTHLAVRSALILVAGDIAELAATCLVSEGVRVSLVANRTYERAKAIAEELGARALTLDEAWDRFGDCDIVLCSTAAPHAVVTWDRVAPAIGRRGGRPLCILDLAVPRDVEPAVAQLENVFLYDLDDLQAVAAQAEAERGGDSPGALV